ncbi:hypothetical protein [Spiroplasma endosymbiont of Nebria brevicollis]
MNKDELAFSIIKEMIDIYKIDKNEKLIPMIKKNMRIFYIKKVVLLFR